MAKLLLTTITIVKKFNSLIFCAVEFLKCLFSKQGCKDTAWLTYKCNFCKPRSKWDLTLFVIGTYDLFSKDNCVLYQIWQTLKGFKLTAQFKKCQLFLNFGINGFDLWCCTPRHCNEDLTGCASENGKKWLQSLNSHKIYNSWNFPLKF